LHRHQTVDRFGYGKKWIQIYSDEKTSTTVLGRSKLQAADMLPHFDQPLNLFRRPQASSIQIETI
jgi:hypothetical protein